MTDSPPGPRPDAADGRRRGFPAAPDAPGRRRAPTADAGRRRGFPAWIWPVYAVLFGASVPWYVPAGAPLRIWLGLPHWVVLSLAASAGVAAFTAFVVHRFWPDE